MSVKQMILSAMMAVILPVQLWASRDANSSTEGTVCEQCNLVQTPSGPRLKNNLGVVAGNIESINNRLKFAGQCSKFADDGRLGVWADNIRSFYMSAKLPFLDKGSPDIHQYCPTYSIMKPTDKANFWVLVLNSMAHFENSCKIANNVPAQGPNGQLVGILQLHSQKEGAYVPQGSDCQNGDGKTAEGSFRCALIMLNTQIRKQNALFARKSYWDVLRPQAESRRVPVIISAIQKYAPCYDESKLNVRGQSLRVEDNLEILNALQNMNTDVSFENGIWKVNDNTLPVNNGYDM